MTYRCIAVGGPQDGQLFKIEGNVRDHIVMNDPIEIRSIFKENPDPNLMNEPISLYRYTRFDMVFPSGVRSGLIFYFYDGKA